MRPVKTGFITRCCANAWISRLLLAWVLACGLGVGTAVARADSAALSALSVERDGEELILSARIDFTLSSVVEDALHKGIPVYFVAEAELLRERWYWADRSLATTRRYTRLMYQPLTRRWRLQVASAPFTNAGLGVALAQHFDNYDEALAAMQRIGRWKIAEPSELDSGVGHVVQLRFRVDMSQLPRPLQIGALGPRSGWNLLVARSQRLPAEHPAP